MTTTPARRPVLRRLHHPVTGVVWLAALTAVAAWLALGGTAEWRTTAAWAMLAASAGFATSGST